MTIFFTADHHFSHENIIEYCNRPFASIEEMDAELVRRWNAVVAPGDTVYHLGDFTLGDASDARHYFSQLNGRIRVLANHDHHDKWWLASKCKSKSGHPVGLLPPLFVLEFPEYGDGKHPQALVLCHFPLAKWDRSHYGSWHLHGHSHGNYRADGFIWDVGVDNTDFTPVSLEDVVNQMAALGWEQD